MARILTIIAKCGDKCLTTFTDNNLRGHTSTAYVPEDLGIGGGDYIKLRIDMETGQILDFPKLSDKEIIYSIKDA